MGYFARYTHNLSNSILKIRSKIKKITVKRTRIDRITQNKEHLFYLTVKVRIKSLKNDNLDFKISM